MTQELGSPRYKVRIRGELACFTRPEMKVERVSYEVITPSAARGILEAILWKPAIEWMVRRIHVLAPIRWTGFRRNEVNEKASVKLAEHAMRGKSPLPFLRIGERRAQRHTLALRDVDYVIEAGFRMTQRAGPGDNPAKMREMFERRLAKGQCYRMPYLGCREFVAEVRVQHEPFESLRETRDLGWMLHDIDFGADGRNVPRFFHARMEHGVIEVPEFQAAAREGDL